MKLLNSGQLPNPRSDGLNQDPSTLSALASEQTLRTEIASLKIRIEQYQSQLKAYSDASLESKRMIEALRSSEELFRLLVEGVQDYAIFMLDPNGLIASWNAGATRIKGFVADEVLGQHFSCFYLPEDIATGKPQAELEIARSKGRYEEEGQRIRKDGSVFWAFVVITRILDDAGMLRGFAKVTRDISDRKRSEEKTRRMVELALNSMILVDSRGLLVLANPQTEKLFGYSQSELIGQPVEILVPQSVREKHPAQRAKFFSNPSVRAMGAGRDLFGQRKDGTQFPVEIGLNPITSGDEMFVLGSIVDITERKRAEESARQQLAELAHAGRLSTVGEMFSGFAHEINQPLAAAANYARACVRFAKSENAVTTEELQSWMEKAAAQADRASEIVRRLGTFMKKERSIRSVLNINQLVENVIALTTVLTSESNAGRSTAVSLELDESLPLIFADKVQIEQVLVNLVRNAIEAMEGVVEGPRKLTVKTRRKVNAIEVSVSDTGHGISPEHQAQLFNPFFTTKDEGMGLGLSISRSIIEAHEGTFEVKSDSRTGTTMSFLLPIFESGDAK